MAVKTFGSERLLSTDINTYLANAGLVYVKSQTVGSGVSSVTISDCFSATYDNYKIIYTGGTMSATTALTAKLGGVASGYFGVLVYSTILSGSILKDQDNNNVYWLYAGGGNPDQCSMNFDVLNAYSGRKYITANVSYGATTTGAIGWYQGWTTFSTTCTSLTIAPATGTISGGTITVYGYRKA